MTPDGRFVAFVSAATNLVSGDTNRIADAFVRDLQSATTILVSTGAVSTNFTALNSSSEAPDITPDGRYVAFFSTATNLVSAARSGGEVYVRDLIAGTTTWASVDARALLGVTDAVSSSQVISADGNYVAYEASARPQSSSAQTGIIARYNLAAGVTDLVESNAHAPLVPYEDIRNVVMTPDGLFLAYVANANSTTAGTNTCIKLWDAQTGTKTLVSGDASSHAPLGTCSWPVIDPTGRYVAFLSSATGLVTNSLAGDYHLYLRDTQAATTTLVAADMNGVGVALSPTTMPAMSGDGSLVAFNP